ncbi:MAG: CopG family transcriptional regulator [Acidimicrobiia bacterium]|nr:CopG family transcriptional regulator [Acidimicrobiia bacterium]
MTTPEQTYTTPAGRVLTDADLDAISNEVEHADYDVEELKTRRRGRPLLGSAPAEVVPVRLDPELKSAVDARARIDHLTTSEVIRRALRKYLDVA